MEKGTVSVQKIIELLNSNSTLKKQVIESLGLKERAIFDKAKIMIEEKEQELLEKNKKIEEKEQELLEKNKKIEEKKQEYNKLKEDYQRVRQACNDTENKILELHYEEKKEETKKMVKKIQELEKKEEVLNNELSSKSETINTLNKKIDELSEIEKQIDKRKKELNSDKIKKDLEKIKIQLEEKEKELNKRKIEEQDSLKKIQELEEKTQELEEKEKKLINVEKELKAQTDELLEVKIQLEKIKSDLQYDVVEKELEKIKEELKSKKDELKEKKIEKDDIDNNLIDLKDELDILEKKVQNKKEKEKKISNELDKKNEEEKLLEEKIDLLKKEEQELLDKLKDLKEKKEEILKENTDLNEKIKSNEEKEKELKEKKEELDEKEDDLKRSKQKIKNEETDKIQRIKEDHESELEHYKEELDDLRKINWDLESENRRLESITSDTSELDDLKQEVSNLTKKNTELRNKLYGKTDERVQENKRLKEKIEKLEKLNEEIEEKNAELSNKNIELSSNNRSLDLYRMKYNEEIRIFEDSKKINEKLCEEIKLLKEKEISEEAKKQAIEQSYFSISELKQREEEVNELNWLRELREKIKTIGFNFSSRLIYAFHTSLKISDWSSLSILAGVSGTGKSELPRLYSKYGGLNFLALAVQPNWDSPASLFGYYNSLEGKFNATSLLRVLYQAQKGVENSINNYLTIVLLDEMNLAHVELYFSELLSKLEILRGKPEGEKLEIDIAENKPYEILLNNSIMWVGTMNEDETTKSLSDKVIDRGNLINFPKPNKLITRNSLIEIEAVEKLKKENWDNWKWKENKSEKLENKIELLKEVVENINEALEGSGRAIGHRVWQSIENYIKNYPLVLSNLNNANEEELNKYIKIAFEDALVQKLIPKLRGLETSGEIRKNCLDKIKDIINQHAAGISKDFEIALRNPYGVFVWTSSSYLEEEIL